jgi:hypothetical protein
MCTEYYDTIDTIFGKLIELYGLNSDLIQLKEELIDGYNKSQGTKSSEILNKIKVRNFKIDECGCIETM